MKALHHSSKGYIYPGQSTVLWGHQAPKTKLPCCLVLLSYRCVKDWLLFEVVDYSSTAGHERPCVWTYLLYLWRAPTGRLYVESSLMLPVILALPLHQDPSAKISVLRREAPPSKRWNDSLPRPCCTICPYSCRMSALELRPAVCKSVSLEVDGSR